LQYELLHTDRDEVHELDFTDGAHPGQRRADARAGDARLADRRVDHAVRTVGLQQPRRHAERAAINAHVLADDEYALVLRHHLRQRLTQRLSDGQFADSAVGILRHTRPP
jgi:hypothetical protein